MIRHRTDRPVKLKSLSLILLMAMTVSLLATGCAHKDGAEKTAQELAEEGMALFDKGRYGRSVKVFENLQDWYPFSQYAILADLKIADAYFSMKEYDSAVAAYEAFERMHPRNEAVPLVIYRIGLSHYNRLDTIDRDQAPARNAIEAFSRLIRQFPDSEYAEKAKQHIVHCRQSLADHEIYVGKFYFKSKRYKAALNRFQQVVENYQDVGDMETADEYIQLCLERLAGEEDKIDEAGEDEAEIGGSFQD